MATSIPSNPSLPSEQPPGLVAHLDHQDDDMTGSFIIASPAQDQPANPGPLAPGSTQARRRQRLPVGPEPPPPSVPQRRGREDETSFYEFERPHKWVVGNRKALSNDTGDSSDEGTDIDEVAAALLALGENGGRDRVRAYHSLP